MTRFETEEISFDDFDEAIQPRPEHCGFDAVVETALSRRGLMGGVLAYGSFAALGSSLVGSVAQAAEQTGGDRFAFDAIAASTEDAVIVPDGYRVQVLVRWGDPLWSDAPPFDPATRGTAASQARAFGDNTDGMDLFVHDGHLLLVVNNEYTNRSVLWGNLAEGAAPSDDDIAKGMMAHGVSVVELTHS